jgi:murein DD-endopeptidase MepM/ murein hydrolase activator NlpD
VLFQTLFSTRYGQTLALIAFGQRHARVAAALGAALLMAGAGGAYAVSQANASNSENLTQISQLIEPVEHLAASADPHYADFSLYRGDSVRSNDSNASLLKRLGVQDGQALRFINQDTVAQKISSYAGRGVQVQTNAQGELQSLMLRYPQGDGLRFTRLSVKRDAAGELRSAEETGYLQTTPRLAYATLRGSVYAAMDSNDIPSTVGDQLIEIFSNQIDFQRNLARGDSFKILYEEMQADGEEMGAGKVLAAEFINRKTTYTAAWFQTADGKGGYYTLDGESLRKSYLAAPLKFTRITSGFGMREHPVWGGQRQHKGVDYGAPSGTPIMSVADGTVKFAGWQNGYGNAVEVVHGNGRSTFYAHMSRIAVRQGEKISQGEQVGNVGSTGWSTGPHLHFEFRINGEFQTPDTMARETGTNPLNAKARRDFAHMAQEWREQLSNARAVQIASNS